MAARDLENIREIRTRLNSVKDDGLVGLSAKAMASVKNVLLVSGDAAQTAAYHTVAQKYEDLDVVLEKMKEGMRFLDGSQGDLKRDWEALRAADAGRVRGALFAVLGCCESLESDGVAKRIKSESQALGRIMDRVLKIKNSDPRSCAALAKLSGEFELSLRILDGVLGGTAYPASEFDAYSKFCDGLEDLGERVARLSESLRFLEDRGTREDWTYFIGQDSEGLKGSMKTAYDSSIRLVDVVR